MKKENRKIFYYINFGMLFLTCFVMGSWFVIQKKKEISHEEKRKLAQAPLFHIDSIAKGAYMKQMDKFVEDQFPMRNHFMSLAFWIKEHKGFAPGGEVLYSSTSLKKNQPKNKGDKTKATIDTSGTAEFVEGPSEENKGIVITNGRALQLFGGNSTQAKAYGNMVNAYYNELKDEVTIYSVVIPSPAEFYLPAKYKHLKEQEKRNINLIYETEVDGIKSIDAYSKIFAHKDEYVYFRTDHHWTGLGAYYAYTAFCETAGLVAVPLDRMTKKSKNKFYGSLYQLTRNSSLAENYDTVHYWKSPVGTKAVRVKKEDQTKEMPSSVIVDAAGGYSVFLGADYPLIKIETENKNGRSIVVVKNSYGNPFATYLVNHYERVFVVDYRYFNPGLVDLIRQYKINDLLFINGAISANTPYHIRRIKAIMHSGKKTEKPKDKDSTETNTVKDTLK